MPWWQSQQSMSKGGGPDAPAAAAAGIGGGGDGGAGDVAVQKVYHNLARKPSFRHGGHGKLRKIDSIKEDINMKADRFIHMFKARLFKQSKSFRQPPAAGPPAPAAGRDGRLI